jgi:glycosyltransferase involved in cell wall biosynthesis
MGGRTDVQVFFVGEDRGIKRVLKNMAEEHRIAEQVHFLGLRNDIPEILSAMDLFVMASHEEGFSNALIEAMAAGLPIVATDVGGNREALDEGSIGILVPPKDPDALAGALSRMIADRDMRDRMAIRAKKHVTERYSVDRMVHCFIQLYTG